MEILASNNIKYSSTISDTGHAYEDCSKGKEAYILLNLNSLLELWPTQCRDKADGFPHQ